MGGAMAISNIDGIAERLKAEGTTSRRRGAEKAQKALTWVYRWGFSTPTLVDQWASPTKAGLCKRLIEKGLLQSWPTPGGGGQKGIPHAVVALTKEGEAIVVAGLNRVEDLLDQAGAEEVQWHQLRHDILVQRATLNMSPHKFLTPKEIKFQSTQGVKQPDCIWVSENGEKMGIELELTPKKRGREIDQTILSLLHAVKKDNPVGLNSIRIFTHSNMILKDYEERLKPGQNINLWEKDTSRRWVLSGKSITVPDWANERFYLVKIEL